mgnify:CR=1 FL=1
MIYRVYTIYDSKAELYCTPFYHRSKGGCLRMFQDMANDRNSQIGQHPEDFTLFEVGEFDDQTGMGQEYEAKVHVAFALDMVDASHQPDATQWKVRPPANGGQTDIEEHIEEQG